MFEREKKEYERAEKEFLKVVDSLLPKTDEDGYAEARIRVDDALDEIRAEVGYE